MTGRMRGFLRLAVTAGIIVLAGGAFWVPAASAAPVIHIPNPFSSTNCKTPPTPGIAGNGPIGTIVPPPATMPPSGNPFGPGAKTTEFEEYGFAGLSWSNYDMGCLPSTSDLSAGIDTTFGGFLFSMAKGIVAIDGAVHNWAASPTWLTALNPAVTQLTVAIHNALFTPWAAIALLIIAATLVFRSHRSDVAGAVTVASWALIVLALTAGVTAFPTWASTQVSALLSSTLSTMSAGFVSPSDEAPAAVQHTSMLVADVLYPAWLRGDFGSSQSAAATQFGPQIFQNQALTWQQAAQPATTIKNTENQEGNNWNKVAAQVKSQDPSLYPTLQGKTSDNRIGTGLEALLGAVIVSTFDLFASGVVVLAMLMVLITVMAFPAIAVIGMNYNARQVITGLLSRTAGMLISAVVYSAGAGVDVKVSQVILGQEGSSGITRVFGPLLALFVLLVFTIGLYIVLRRVRVGRTADLHENLGRTAVIADLASRAHLFG